MSPALSPSLLSHSCSPFPLGSPAVKDWQQHSPGPTASVAPLPVGLAVALCRLQDPRTLASRCSTACLLLWFGFPSHRPISVPSASLPWPWLPGLSAASGRGSRAAVSGEVLGWGSPRGAGAGAGASFLPSRPGEARGAGMSWLHTLLLAQCRLSIASSAGNLAGTALAAPTAAGQDGTRMGCRLTSRPAPLSCGAFPFLHPRRQRDELPAPSSARDIPDPDRVGRPRTLQALVCEGHVT